MGSFLAGYLPFLVILAALVAINFATYGAFAFDKRAAIEGEWRLPERLLLWMAAFGGTVGAMVAQERLRHKTRKQPFATHLLLIAGGQILLVIALLIPASRHFIIDTVLLK